MDTDQKKTRRTILFIFGPVALILFVMIYVVIFVATPQKTSGPDTDEAALARSK
jgi:hypothetical protein